MHFHLEFIDEFAPAPDMARLLHSGFPWPKNNENRISLKGLHQLNCSALCTLTRFCHPPPAKPASIAELLSHSIQPTVPSRPTQVPHAHFITAWTLDFFVPSEPSPAAKVSVRPHPKCTSLVPPSATASRPSNPNWVAASLIALENGSSSIKPANNCSRESRAQCRPSTTSPTP